MKRDTKSSVLILLHVIVSLVQWTQTTVLIELTDRRDSLVLRVVFFGYITAVFHLIYAVLLYVYLNIHLVERARWIEYSITASLMISVLAELSRATCDDLGQVWLVGLNITMMFLGLLGDEIARSFSHVTPSLRACVTLPGMLPFCFAWTPIGISFYHQLAIASNRIPTMVYAIIPVMFILNCLFAVAHVYRNYTLEYVNADYGYVALSLGSKTVLMWMLFGGVIRR